jgi:endonuclease/exonuclease/phosphatase family metal-dependent hydrolase
VTQAEGERLRVATFNAGIHPEWFPEVPQRRAALIDALAGLPADVVALQEVWLAEDRSLVGEGFPHVVEADPLPVRPGGWAADGASGLMLLSRISPDSVRVVPLASSLVRRAVILTEIAGVTFLATHLTANLSHAEHPEPGGWAYEHRTQVEFILGLVEEIEGPVILAGDLNCGPERGHLAAEFGTSYDLLRGAFEANPLADRADPPCTWCPDNPMVDFPAAAVIDHVLVSGCSPLGAERIFDDPIPVEGGSSPLSDHYGVLVTLALR